MPVVYLIADSKMGVREQDMAEMTALRGPTSGTERPPVAAVRFDVAEPWLNSRVARGWSPTFLGAIHLEKRRWRAVT